MQFSKCLILHFLVLRLDHFSPASINPARFSFPFYRQPLPTLFKMKTKKISVDFSKSYLRKHFSTGISPSFPKKISRGVCPQTMLM